MIGTTVNVLSGTSVNLFKADDTPDVPFNISSKQPMIDVAYPISRHKENKFPTIAESCHVIRLYNISSLIWAKENDIKWYDY